MYALPGAPSTHRRIPPAVYRRRRLSAALGGAAILVTFALLADIVAGGTTGRAVLERVVAIGVVVLWAHCGLALWRWNRSSSASATAIASSADATARATVSGAEPGGSCLPSGSVPVHSRSRRAQVA